MEEAVRSTTDGFIAINSTRADNSYGQLAFFQHSGLRRRGIRAQYPIWLLCNVEGILHISSRMVCGHIQGCKIMPVVLNLRTLCHHETNFIKNTDNFVFCDL